MLYFTTFLGRREALRVSSGRRQEGLWIQTTAVTVNMQLRYGKLFGACLSSSSRYPTFSVISEVTSRGRC